MPRLSTSVRAAAVSILFLSIAHFVFWALLAAWVYTSGLNDGQYTMLFVAQCLISVGGFAGVLVAVGIFKAKNWARLAVLTLGAIVGFFSALATLVLVLLFLVGPNIFDSLVGASHSNMIKLAILCAFVFSLSLWWIVLFSRPHVAEQFGAELAIAAPALSNKPACPPPIALLAWLIIISAVLSALLGFTVNGMIPAMLFTQVYSGHSGQWIWTINIAILLLCGIGLLKLQRWSYTATIAFHVFWLVSIFISQISPAYPEYIRTCLNFFRIPQNYPGVNLLRFPQWISAIATAIPTALLIAGLFYYRGSFLKAVEESDRFSS